MVRALLTSRWMMAVLFGLVLALTAPMVRAVDPVEVYDKPDSTTSNQYLMTGTTKSAKLDSGDTAWMLTSSALVLMMTGPGLALFYSGLVRRKNVLATMMQSFILMAVVTIAWGIIGTAWRLTLAARS